MKIQAKDLKIGDMAQALDGNFYLIHSSGYGINDTRFRIVWGNVKTVEFISPLRDVIIKPRQ